MSNEVTRAQFIAKLQGMLAATPSNSAIAKHLAKVEAMNEAEWVAHRAKLEYLGNMAKPSVKRMAAEARKAAK